MTSTPPIVSLTDVGKRYVKYEDTPTLIQGMLRRSRGKKRSTLWAVRHVNLEVQPGESVGVIGRNGAGKSTMLAMLAGVTAPTEGVVAVRGRVAPLLRLGVGFHDELTGRENIYINGTILGMSEPEIDAVFDDIVSFAELQEFIDTPVKFYSSGMQARLGFSVAVSSRPDVLIVDEVLAVGDMGFQARSFDRMLALKEEGTTILVVSHNLDSIRRVCSRVLVLNSGEPYFQGPTEEGLGHYHELLRVSWEDVTRSLGEDAPEATLDTPVEALGLELLDAQSAPASTFQAGSRMTMRLHMRVRETVKDPIVGLWLANQANVLIFRYANFGEQLGQLDAGTELYFDVDLNLHLVTGTYTIASWLGWDGGGLEHVRGPLRSFYVVSKYKRGIADLGATCEVRVVGGTGAEGAGAALTDNPANASDPRAL